MISDPGAPLIKPYLYKSAVLHAGLFLALFFIPKSVTLPANEVYRIDFIGASPEIIGRTETAPGGPARPATAAGPIQPESQKDEFAAHVSHAPLPRPSILSSPRDARKTPAPPPVSTPASSNRTPGAAGSSGEAAVETDLPNFPYPWYISQIRASLWNQWSSKMGTGGGEATVQFSILKDGSAVDVRIESSSGDKEIDYIALGAVQGALPFPPLPQGYPDKFLVIHVRFKS